MSEPVPRIKAKPIPWLDALLSEPDTLHTLLAERGSPLHLHHTGPFRENVAALTTTAAAAGVDLGVFFARKANKALCYVDAAIDTGIGIDLASDQELVQALNRGAAPDRLVVTSAVKTDSLLSRCCENEILVVLDNHDETARYAEIAQRAGHRPPVAVRISNFEFEATRAGPSRFGFDLTDPRLVEDVTAFDVDLDVRGLHFHIDGYAAADRVDALADAIRLHDQLAFGGIDIEFVDIGGGFPVTYTDRSDQWSEFWACLDDALLGRRKPVTYRNDGYGQIVVDGHIAGPRHAYPHHQDLVGVDWLRTILTASPTDEETGDIAQRLARRNLELRCEPGRALLDGCGATISTVVHTKPLGDDLLIGVDMNTSNCRTQKSELLTDPIHLPLRCGPRNPAAGYLTGAYCSESDVILRRRLAFDHRPQNGDLIVVPNTAGYLMHFTESRSHQFPLPQNTYLGPHLTTWTLDPIDCT